MLLKLEDINETSKYFNYTFCDDQAVKLTIKSIVPENFLKDFSYDVKLSPSIEYVPNSLRLNCMEYLGVVLKRSINSIHVQSGNVLFLFVSDIKSFKPGLDVWVVIQKKKS
jgi:hypothetical protein